MKFGEWIAREKTREARPSYPWGSRYLKVLELVETQREFLAVSGSVLDADNYAEGVTLDEAALTKRCDELRTRIWALEAELMKG